jgi:RHS repeat-associated protein
VLSLFDYVDVIAYNDYYPFGMLMEGRNGASGSWDAGYKFTGKERDVETNYDYFGARYYDARIGRWLSRDPLAEKYPSLSPYVYCADNPLKFVDPNGKEITNPNRIILGNKALIAALIKFNNKIAEITGMKSSEFTIRISGGDRYTAIVPMKVDGVVVKELKVPASRTNNELIWNSAENTRHYESQGAVAVDLVRVKGNISDDVIRKASVAAGFDEILMEYPNDSHFHIGLPVNPYAVLTPRYTPMFEETRETENGSSQSGSGTNTGTTESTYDWWKRTSGIQSTQGQINTIMGKSE